MERDYVVDVQKKTINEKKETRPESNFMLLALH
jgi:hypothetical protein